MKLFRPELACTPDDCRIGVVIPVYNRRTILLETLPYVVEQTLPPAHLAIVDDGSTDGTSAAAEAWLALGDTAAALRSLRFMLDAASTSTPYFPQQSAAFTPVYFVPRSMLLRADLAAATGQTDEARTWYQRFIDAWSTAVPELQPTVERARQSLARLNARP